jgi:protocatechuate 3,4-dioxygenase alpha subunit
VLDNQSHSLFGPTPWQTVGPFFHFALPFRGCADLTGASDAGARPDLMDPLYDRLYRPPGRTAPAGEAIAITGRVLDAAGEGVCDALVEIWHADAAGRFPPCGGDDAFIGFGRCATQEDGGFCFATIKPGAVQPDAPHIAVGVLGRGILRRLVTRLYFAGEPENAHDAVLALVPAERRATLLATPSASGYCFDIRLQGPGETVFFQC